MTATTPPAGPPATRPQPRGADLGTLGGISWLLRRDGRPYRSLLGPPAATWQVALGALGVLVASVPAMVLGTEVNKAFYGDATPPMFAVVDVPPLASTVSVLVMPLLAELAEPVAYLGVALPRLERRIGRPWIAAAIVVVVWAAEHACYPLLTSGGSLDFRLAAYRVVSVLPFLATWTAAYGLLRPWPAAAADHGGQVGVQRRHRARRGPGHSRMRSSHHGLRSTMIRPDGSRVATGMEVAVEQEHGGTRLTILHRGGVTVDGREQFAGSWASILDGLGRVVAARVTGMDGP